MERNSKGQFNDGTRNESHEDKMKRVASMKVAAKKSDSYLGDLKHSPLYNVWRAFMFTKKGKSIGCSERWRNFKLFFEDMAGGYTVGFRLVRENKNLGFTIENCRWMSESDAALMRRDGILLEHNGEIKLLKEWSLIYGLPYNGLKQKNNNKKGYTSSEILFGKIRGNKRSLMDENQISEAKLKSKASKMAASYRCRDKKKNLISDIDPEFILTHIFFKECYYCASTKNLGCDRKDNNKGHTKDNVIPCCYVCNVVRSNLFTVYEMKKIGSVINEINTLRLMPDKFKIEIK